MDIRARRQLAGQAGDQCGGHIAAANECYFHTCPFS
jgi:hypothetical protein